MKRQKILMTGMPSKYCLIQTPFLVVVVVVAVVVVAVVVVVVAVGVVVAVVSPAAVSTEQ